MQRAATAVAQDASAFELRRLLERLREGLYDPLAVRLLTVHHEALDTLIQDDLRHAAAGAGRHLCLCGAYGQGKSHTLAYIRECALQQGYAVSTINLDPREMPLHQFRQVYRALLRTMTVPARPGEATTPVSFIEAWQTWARTQASAATDPALALTTLVPAHMPHVFKAILVALAQATLEIPAGRRILKQYRDFRPADFPWTLRRALYGDVVPVTRLRAALKYRQVSFYRQGSLALQGHEPFLHMTLALPQLLRTMGYQGWVLLFDEGEAIAQGPRPARARSYRLLHQVLCPDSPVPGLYPVFAFTPDFFQRLQEEDYDLPDFERHYAQAWRHLSVYHLRGLSLAVWRELCSSLVGLHAAAYGWHADEEHLVALLASRLATLPLHDPRVTLKALVDELDQVQQQTLFIQRAGTGH